MSAEDSKTHVDAAIPAQPSKARLWMIVTVAGVFAGLGSWLGGEAVLDFFKPELFKTAIQGLSRDQPTPASLAVAELKNAKLTFAILGGVLGLTMGVAGGLIRGCGKAATGAGLLGLILGCAAGFGASALVVPVYQNHVDEIGTSLVIPLLTHGSIWAIVGAASGLAFALGRDGRKLLLLGLLGGMLGGFLGAGVYEIVASVAFPFDQTNQPISISSLSRLTARLAVTLCVAIFVAKITNHPRDNRPQHSLSPIKARETARPA